MRIEFPGAVYHVTSRGNARQPIFFDEEDMKLFLSKLAASVERYELVIHAYCLMTNHYHLLLETQKPNLSLAMQRVNGDYTQAFNRKYGRVGHLFQGRYKAVLIQKETHLLEVCRYVVLNPMRARMVKSVGEWKWSSFPATAGMDKKPTFLFIDWILRRFHKEEAEAMSRYIKFVNQGLLRKASPLSRANAQMVLGTEGFMDKWKDLIETSKEIKEIPRLQRQLLRIPIEKIFLNYAQLTKDQLAEKIAEAHIKHGFTLTEISRHLDIHYSTAGRLLKKLERKNNNE